MSKRVVLPSLAELEPLTNEEFAAWWRALVGEPPAAMLQDRAEMIRLLAEGLSAAEAPPVPPGGSRPREAALTLVSSRPNVARTREAEWTKG